MDGLISVFLLYVVFSAITSSSVFHRYTCRGPILYSITCNQIYDKKGNLNHYNNLLTQIERHFALKLMVTMWAQLLTNAVILSSVYSTPLRTIFITSNNTSAYCDPENNRLCFTLQQLAEQIDDSENFGVLNHNVSLTFMPGKHFLLGGIMLNNTVGNIVLKGQIENGQKPEISCRNKSCFIFHNSTSIHIESLVFSECFNEDFDGGAFIISKADIVNISQCSFVNNFIRRRGGAMRLQLIKNVYLQETSFINNSAICHSFDMFSYLGSVHCKRSCIASSGAISAFHISSFVITNSLFEGNIASCFNGAVVVVVSNASINNSTFTRNFALASTGSGGALFIGESDVEILDSVFDKNFAVEGGAIVSLSSSINISTSYFLFNSAGFVGGGAASFIDTKLFIDKSTFEMNTGFLGGAIKITANNQNALISDSFFQRNFNYYLNGAGGAMYVSLSGTPDCTFSCNGDLILSGNETVVFIDDCNFKSNTGGLIAGAIRGIRGVLNVRNSRFSENTVSTGGAVALRSNFAYFQNNTFANNSVTASGGAIYLSGAILKSSSNNYSNNLGESGGGAISAVTNGTIFTSNDLYFNNEAVTFGGAVSAIKSDVHCTCSTFLKNRVLVNGGAVSMLEGRFSSTGSLYKSNHASQRGGALMLDQSLTRISKDYYQNNNARVTGAAIVQTGASIQLHSVTFTENQALRRDELHTVKLITTQGQCDNLSFTNNTGSVYLFNSRLNFSGSIFFADNIGEAGGAITVVQGLVFFKANSNVSITGNNATYGGGILLSQSELRVNTPLLKINKNTAKTSGGGIHTFVSQISISVNQSFGPISISNNLAGKEGGAVNAIATSLNFFHGPVFFSSNKAQKGGVVSLSEGSKIYIHKSMQEVIGDELSVKVVFFNNSAEYGGALYVNDASNTGILCRQTPLSSNQIQSISECFIQTLHRYYPQLLHTHFNQFNYINFFFYSNNGNMAGDDIFGGLLDRCQINSFSEVNNNFAAVAPYELNGFDYLKTIAQFNILNINYTRLTQPFDPKFIADTITSESVEGLITSNPVQVCFCVNDSYSCSYQWQQIFAQRGQLFSVRLVTVDQVENAVAGIVVASVPTDGSRLKIGQSRQATRKVCTELGFNIFSPKVNATLELYPDGPCNNIGISRKTLTITFLPCDCPSGLQPAPLDNECKCECDVSLESFASSCQLESENIIIVREMVKVWIHYYESGNESGFLLSNCPYDYCVNEPVNLSISLPMNVDIQCAYNRSGIMCGECEEGLSLVFGSSRCVQCSNNYLALLIAFAFAGIVLVAFILILNMTVAVGTIHGLILYANIVGANSPVFLPSETVLRIFVSWVNLDLGIETCFYDGMDSYAKVMLQLVFPSYIILLAALIIIVSKYWDLFAKLISYKNPIATLCTLFLLSYSKLLRTIIASLQFTNLIYPDGSSNILWLYDPNVSYYRPERIPFFLSAIVIIILGSTYTVLLFFSQWLRKIQIQKMHKLFQNNKYNAFIDAYHAPFVFKQRYWIGVLLLTRLIHHLLSSVLDESIHSLIVAALLCTLLTLKILTGEVYKNKLISILETSFIFNLLLFSVGTYYIINTNGDQVALASTSVLTAFVTFSAIVIYHTYTYLVKNSSAYSKLMLAMKKGRSNADGPHDQEVTDEPRLRNLQTPYLREPVVESNTSL